MGFRTLVIVVAVVGLTAGASFGGGLAYGRLRAPAAAAATGGAVENAAGQAGAQGQGGAAALAALRAGGAGASGGGGTAGALLGTVERIDGNRITLRTPQGSVTVALVPDTTVRKTVEGSVADIAVGQTLSATGERGADGTVTARLVQLQSEGSAGAGTGARGGPAGGPGGRAGGAAGN